MAPEKYKGRRREIYFPSEQDLKRWEALAEAADIPFSKWIYDTVELHLNSGQASPRAQAAQEAAALKKELTALRDELHLKSTLLERYESELYKLRHPGFERLAQPGDREYGGELLALLKAGGTLSQPDILKGLRISPRDTEALKLIRTQLEGLKGYGLVEESLGGWRWIG